MEWIGTQAHTNKANRHITSNNTNTAVLNKKYNNNNKNNTKETKIKQTNHKDTIEVSSAEELLFKNNNMKFILYTCI
eukprot:gene11348-7860_t